MARAENRRKSKGRWLGSYFDEWANRGDNPFVRDRITDSDAVAVSMLSIKVPARAIIGLSM